MAAAFPAVLVLPYEQLCDASGKYYATGYGNGGAMTMTSKGAQVSPLPWVTGGMGLFQWSTQGEGSFRPA
jgi:hypothetical protein